MISSEASLRDILPNEVPPKGSVYEIVQKIENFGTQNGGDALIQAERRTGKELGSKVSSTIVSPTKKITKYKNSQATMNIQSDQETSKADFPLEEVTIFENSLKESPNRLSDYESKPHIDRPAKIKYGSKEVIIKDGKAIDVDRKHCCAVQKHQKGLLALASHGCVSTLERYCLSMKKCFKKVVTKARLKNKELHRSLKNKEHHRPLKKQICLNHSGGDHPVRSGEHSNKIEVTNLQVQRNTQLHICTHLDEVTEACSTDEESRLRHYIPKCRRDCQRRHEMHKQLSYTPVYVMSSSNESLGNETSSMEDTRAVHSLAPGIFESSSCVCNHTSRKFKKSIKRTRNPGYYLVKIPDRSDSGILCLNNERNICSRKFRHTKNYLMKQFKSHSGSWAKKIKKKPKIEEDSDDFYSDEHIVIKKPNRRTSKCLICKDCVKNSKEKHYLNDPYVYSVTGINSVDAKKGSHEKRLSIDKEKSKSLKSSKNIKPEYLYHSLNCKCPECKAQRDIYEKFTPSKYKGCVCKDCDENNRKTGCLCKNCYYSCKTKSNSLKARRINVCRCCKCEKCCCSENHKEFDFDETDLHKIVYAQKNSPDNSCKSMGKTSKSNIVLNNKKDESLCEYVHGSETISEVNLAHCSNENINDLECSASLTACATYQKEKPLTKVETKPSSKSFILNKNHSFEELTCTNLQILTQTPHYDTT